MLLKNGGFDLSCTTGRGEASIRNGIMLHAVVRHYQLTSDEASLDLAKTGLANHLIGLSRYFNYRGEFFGHVHSAAWVAAGLVLLGRLTGTDRYVEFGRMIYEYVRSLSSSFGWVPEYAQWHPMSEEHCETCCIKDMIECGLELVDAGYDEPWDLVNRFVRNQLDEQQIKDGSFVPVDSSRADRRAGHHLAAPRHAGRRRVVGRRGAELDLARALPVRSPVAASGRRRRRWRWSGAASWRSATASSRSTSPSSATLRWPRSRSATPTRER